MPQDIIKRILASTLKSLKRLPNVVGAGIGKRRRNNVTTDEDVLHVFVETKVSIHTLSTAQIIPQHVWSPLSDDPIPTDVIQVGRIIALSNQDAFRPVLGGISVSNPLDFSSGTLGGIFRDKSDNLPVLLSNNHVFARTNAASIGESIEQPSPFDNPGGGVIATLKRFVQLVDPPLVNQVDAAIAGLHPSLANNIDLGITEVGLIRSIAQNVQPGLVVQKSGRTSELTLGTVLSTNATISVNYCSPSDCIKDFENQIVTTAMLDPGDSGSLLLTLNNALVGLGYAGDNDVSVFSPIGFVFNSINIENYKMSIIVNFKDPIHNGFFYKKMTDCHHDSAYTLSHGGFFILYPDDLITPNTAVLKRWKTARYPHKYAIGITSPGLSYVEDVALGRIATSQLEDTLPLNEWINAHGDRFYTTDALGGGINTTLYTEQPTPIGYCANVTSHRFG